MNLIFKEDLRGVISINSDFFWSLKVGSTRLKYLLSSSRDTILENLSLQCAHNNEEFLDPWIKGSNVVLIWKKSPPLTRSVTCCLLEPLI